MTKIFFLLFVPTLLFAQDHTFNGAATSASSATKGSMGVTGASEVIALDQNTWAKVTNGTSDLFSEAGTGVNTTIDGDSITVGNTGTCFAWLHMSFAGTASDVYECTLYINGVATTEPGLFFDRTTTNNSIGSATFGGLIDLTADDGISIWVRNTGDNDDPTVINCSLVVFQL